MTASTTKDIAQGQQAFYNYVAIPWFEQGQQRQLLSGVPLLMLFLIVARVIPALGVHLEACQRNCTEWAKGLL